MRAETVIAVTVAILVVLFSFQARHALPCQPAILPAGLSAGMAGLSRGCAQRFGTGLVGKSFAPVLLAWLLSIAAIGVYNAARYHPRIWLALWPGYGIAFFRRCAGWLCSRVWRGSRPASDTSW